MFQATSSCAVNGPAGDASIVNGGTKLVAVDEMTSKDYYFDSYAHFGIHEVCFLSLYRL